MDYLALLYLAVLIAKIVKTHTFVFSLFFQMFFALLSERFTTFRWPRAQSLALLYLAVLIAKIVKTHTFVFSLFFFKCFLLYCLSVLYYISLATSAKFFTLTLSSNFKEALTTVYLSDARSCHVVCFWV